MQSHDGERSQMEALGEELSGTAAVQLPLQLQLAGAPVGEEVEWVEEPVYRNMPSELCMDTITLADPPDPGVASFFPVGNGWPSSSKFSLENPVDLKDTAAGAFESTLPQPQTAPINTALSRVAVAEAEPADALCPPKLKRQKASHFDWEPSPTAGWTYQSLSPKMVAQHAQMIGKQVGEYQVCQFFAQHKDEYQTCPAYADYYHHWQSEIHHTLGMVPVH